MPGPEIRPATDREIEGVHWYPAVRSSKRRDNPVLNNLLVVLEENPVAIVDIKASGITSQEQIRRYARKRGIALNTVYSHDFRAIFVRKDPILHPSGE